VEPGYNDISLSDTSHIALDILWYQLHASVRKTLLYNDTKSVTCKTLYLKWVQTFNHPTRLTVRLYAIEFPTVRHHKSIINVSKIQSSTNQLMIFIKIYSYVVLSTTCFSASYGPFSGWLVILSKVKYTINNVIAFLTFCWPCISVYLSQ